MPNQYSFTQDGKHFLVKAQATVQKTAQKLVPMSPVDGPPLPRSLNIKWPWVKK